MKTFKIISIILFCLIIPVVKAQLPPNYLGLSADSISHLAKKQHYKLRQSYTINDGEFEVQYYTDIDLNGGKNSIGNSMYGCFYRFSCNKKENRCIECKYGFLKKNDMNYIKKLLNKSNQYIKDGTFKSEWGWNSIDDKSYVFLDSGDRDLLGIYELIYRKRLVSDVLSQQSLNCLGLSVDSISHLAKKQHYKFLDSTYIFTNTEFEVEYITDFDWKVRRNSFGNSMWRCTYVFSKDKSRCIECEYSFHMMDDVDYFTKLLNNDPHYIKDGTYRTSWGWDSIDDKSYVYIQNETDMGERFNIIYSLRTPK